MDIHVEEITTQNAVGGIWSKNTHNIRSGICHQIILGSNASDLTFDFKLIDDKSNVVYDTIRREKTATFVLDDEINLPMHGIYTARVYNASSDGTFSGRLIIRDE
jgi:hypothetical protein